MSHFLRNIIDHICYFLGITQLISYCQLGGRPEFPTACFTLNPNLDADRIAYPFLLTVAAPQGIYFEEKFATYEEASKAIFDLTYQAASCEGPFEDFEIGLISSVEGEGLIVRPRNDWSSFSLSFVHTAGLFVARVQGQQRAAEVGYDIQEALVGTTVATQAGSVTFKQVTLEQSDGANDEYDPYAAVKLCITYSPAGIHSLSFGSMKKIERVLINAIGEKGLGFEVKLRGYYH